MRARIRRLIVLYLFLLLGPASCIPIGDSAARFRGRILVNGEPAKECELSLYLASTDQHVETILISSEFEETFVIAPGKGDYYATITCRNSRDEFRSETLQLGSPRAYEKGVDLGTVSLSYAGPE